MRRALAALVATVATATGVPTAASAVPLPRQTADLPVTITVEELSPVLRPGAGAALRVAGRVTNVGDDDVRRPRVRLLLGNPLGSRSQLDNDVTVGFAGRTISDEDQRVADLRPRGVDTASFAFDIPVEDLRLDPNAAHVYPLRVEVRSRGVLRGVASTYVPWWPVGTARTRISWVWPLAERSHRALGDDFYDEDLLDELGDGRLGTLLDAGAAAPDTLALTWAVDGQLLDELTTLSNGYTVRARDRDAPRRDGRTEAATWLDGVKQAVKRGTVIALPYADADITSLAGTTLATDATAAVRLGQETVRRTLDAGVDDRLAWPYGGELDVRTQALLASTGASGIVTAERWLPLQNAPNYTPSAVYPLQSNAVGRLTALVADGRLAELVAAGPGEEGRRLAVQRYLAETAMITLERPSLARTLVVAPPHLWDPDPHYAAQLLAETAAVPWLEPIPLAAALADPPSPVTRTLASRAGEQVLPAAYLRDVAASRRGLERYRAILTNPGELPARIDDALLRAGSALWRDAQGEGRRLVRTADERVRGEFGRLAVATGGVVTLAGTTGKVPVTIVNDLEQAVRVRVRLRTRGRLLLEEECYDGCRPVTIAPGRVTLVVRGEAVTAGVFPIFVDLLPPAPDDSLLIPSATLRVRSKNYGVVALVITVGAGGLLLVASGVRLVRRRRRARHSHGGSADPTEAVAGAAT